MDFLLSVIGTAGSAATLYDFVSGKLRDDNKLFKRQLRRNIDVVCEAAIEAIGESSEFKDVIPSFAADIIYEEVIRALESKEQVSIEEFQKKLEIPRHDIFEHLIKLIDAELQKSFEYSQRDYNAWSRQKTKDMEVRLSDINNIVTQIKEIIENNDEPYITRVEDYWNDYGINTNPQLTPECLMLGRENQIIELTKWLYSPSNCMLVKAESALEARLFIISAIMNMDEDEKNDIINRIIVIKNTEHWKEAIKRANGQSILVPMFPITDELYYSQDLHLLFPVSKFDPLSKLDNQVSINLPRYNKILFNELLDLLGYDIYEHNIAFDTKRSFTALYRKITTNPTRKMPKWAEMKNMKELLAAMFAGGWNANSASDRRLIEILSGVDYDNYSSKMYVWADIEDAPIIIRNSNFYTVATQDLWNFLYSKIVPNDMENIKKCLLDIISQENSMFELPEEQWPYANIYGKKQEYSQTLTQGLMITMIMLTERDGHESLFNIASTKAWCTSVIKQGLEQICTWQQWNTIAPSLPLLAEISPLAVLEKIEEAVRKNNKEFWKMFSPSKDIMWGRNYYTHVLWALEKLVWFDESVVRAIKLLAAIGEHNIEYKMVNTPTRSLYEIFCLWHPKSCLKTEERMELLNIIVSSYPTVGRELIKSLLPSNHSTSTPIVKPKWREFHDYYPDGVFRDERILSAKKILEMSIEFPNFDKEHWLNMIDKIDQFTWCFDTFAKKLNEVCEKFSEDELFELQDKLRREISRHRKFRNSKWSVAEEIIAKWEKLFQQITKDNIGVYRYLLKFNPQLLNPIPYEADKQTDYEQKRMEIRNLRNVAFEEIANKFGKEAFLQFSTEAEDTYDWGEIIAENLLGYKYDFSELRKIKDINQNLYSNILWILNHHNGLDVLMEIIGSENSLTDDEIGEIMCCTPLSMEVWLRIEKFSSEVAEYYWKHVRVFRLQNVNDDTQDYFIEKLLYYDRPFSAINVIAYTKYNNPQTLMSILKKFLDLQNHVEKDGSTATSVNDYIHELFDKLYNNLNADDMDIARLELAYIPLFQYEGKPQGLIRCFTKMPELFVEFISIVWKPDNYDENSTLAKDQNIISRCHDALRLFNEIPGCNTKLIDKSIFQYWIQSTKQIAANLGYTNAFKISIGKLLSYSPVGSDGVFPHEIVRDYLESHSSETLIDVFVCEKINQRGIHSPTGGVQEEKMAKQYKDDAAEIRVKFPISATVLDNLSEWYLDDSLRDKMREYDDFSFLY